MNGWNDSTAWNVIRFRLGINSYFLYDSIAFDHPRPYSGIIENKAVSTIMEAANA